MSRYGSVFRAYLISGLQYRAAAWAGIGTQLFFGLIKVMIFTGFYRSTTLPQPMNFPQVVDYLWLGQALLLILPFRVDRELTGLIRTGNLAYEMSRPVNLYIYWYARALAQRLAPVFLRVFPMIIITTLAFPLIGLGEWGLKLPASLPAAGLFVLSLGAAFFLAASISVLMSISALWTLSAEGIDQLLPSFIWIFSGIIIPLPFFPEAAQKVFRWLPFRGLIDIPFRIYNGSIGGDMVLRSLGIQILWTIALVVAGRLLLIKGLRRLVVQGG